MSKKKHKTYRVKPFVLNDLPWIDQKLCEFEVHIWLWKTTADMRAFFSPPEEDGDAFTEADQSGSFEAWVHLSEEELLDEYIVHESQHVAELAMVRALGISSISLAESNAPTDHPSHQFIYLSHLVYCGIQSRLLSHGYGSYARTIEYNRARQAARRQAAKVSAGK